MFDIFIATLNPMLTLFLCMTVGYTLSKSGIMPKNSAEVLSKLETWVFCPALNFMAMSNYCTLESLGEHGVNTLIATAAISVAIGIAIPLSGAFSHNKSERGIYKYALAFGNFGYLGDPIIYALSGYNLEFLAYYKLFTLPLSIMVYTWGMCVLVPEEKRKGNVLKNIFNLPMISLFLGIAVGLFGLQGILFDFEIDTLNNLKDCMGPVAMLIAGLTVARFGLVDMLKNKKVYVATALRLIVLPVFLVTLVYFTKELFGLVLSTEINNDVVYFAFIAFAAPLGLNTVVFPEAFGGDSRPGASMAMISHTLCVITIPILYMIMTEILGAPSFG